MLDVRDLRSNLEGIKTALDKRKKEYHLDTFVTLDQQRRSLIQEVEELKNKQNSTSKEVPKLKKEGKDTTALMAEMKLLSAKIKELDGKITEVDEELSNFLYTLPNTPNALVPAGADDTDNEEMRKWGEPTKFDFEPKPHWDLGKEIGRAHV